MGGWNSGSIRRSYRLRDDELHRASVKDLLPSIRQRTVAFGPPGFCTLVSRPGNVTSLSFDEIPSVPYGLGNATIRIDLTTTRPTYGGQRFWFVCPRTTCRRRCSVLYREATTNVRAFTCRQCVRMRYESQVLGKADTIASRLARPLTRLLRADGTVARPRYMHAKTYQRLSQQIAPLWGHLRQVDPLYRRASADLEDVERHARLGVARHVAMLERGMRKAKPAAPTPR